MRKLVFKKFLILLAICALILLFGADISAAQAKFTQDELAYMPATTLIELFKQGIVTPSEVLEAQIQRVKKYNGEYNTSLRDLKDELDTFNAGKVNAITFDNFEEARKLAKEAELRYRNGTARRLEGITVCVKDEFAVKGWRTQSGSILLKDSEPSDHDDPIIKKLRAEGAIFVFQTTVPEMYISPMTWTRLYGVTRNPWNLYYGSGGSSGGSGAALAAGFCTLATGSDMGGSIRIPAAMNGVYGFKAPFGRVATSDNAYETCGPLARTFDDLVLMQDIVCGPHPAVQSSLRPKLDYPKEYPSVKGQKIAVAYFKNWTEDGLDPDVVHSMDTVVKTLQQAGAQVDKIEIDIDGKEFAEKYAKGIMSSDMYVLYMSIKDSMDETCTYTKKIGKVCASVSPEDQVAATGALADLHNQIQEKVFEKNYIALIMPTLVSPRFPADLEATPEKLVDVNGHNYPGTRAILTPLWNLASRYPVVNVPVELSGKNVPVGVQVVGNTYDDLAAFRVASALSKKLAPFYQEGRFPDFRNKK